MGPSSARAAHEAHKMTTPPHTHTRPLNINISDATHKALKLASFEAGVPMTDIASPAITREISTIPLGQKLLTITIGLSGDRWEGYKIIAMVHRGTVCTPTLTHTMLISGQIDLVKQHFAQLEQALTTALHTHTQAQDQDQDQDQDTQG